MHNLSGGANELHKLNPVFVIVHSNNSHLIYQTDLKVTTEFGDFFPRT